MSNTKTIKEKGKKGLLRLLFSRTGLIILFLLVELFVLFGLFRIFGNHIYLAFGGSRIISFFMIVYLLNNSQNPSVKITWIVLVLVLPIFSTLLYWYILTDLGHKIEKKKLIRIEEEFNRAIPQDDSICKKLQEENERELLNLHRYINLSTGQNIYDKTDVSYYKIGEEMFAKMLEKLKSAKDFIFMEYFIVDKGYMWNTILDILKEKVKEGVEVRFMYDGMCALALLPYSYPEELEKYGIKTKMFAPVRPFISTHYDNRDHRKILVVDGKCAFTGGINLADEYINKKVKYGHWKDTGIMLEGKAVKAFTLMFLKMWNITEKENENFQKYIDIEEEKNVDGYVMPYGESPFNGELLAENVYIDIINNAKEYVYITTPYLVTDNEVISALKLAAKKNIDVRIILPHIPDKEIAFSLAHTYYKELILAGVKIYEYTPGFIHAKMFVSDDIKAVVGTINLDYRSLYHHFECAAYLYKLKAVLDVKKDIVETFEKSQLITLEYLNKDKLSRKIRGKLLKIIAPLI